MIPDYREPTSPGKMLLYEFLYPMGISEEQFFNKLGWKTRVRLIRIINNTHRISDQIARDFSKLLGTTPEFWTNLQRNWDLWYLSKQCASQKTPKEYPKLKSKKPSSNGSPTEMT